MGEVSEGSHRAGSRGSARSAKSKIEGSRRDRRDRSDRRQRDSQESAQVNLLGGVRKRVQGPGPSQEDPLHAADHRRLPVRRARPDAGDRRRGGAGVRQSGRQGGVFQFINLFSGGALTQLAIFALGIMPYITSSIIMQLLTVVIPKLEAWSKEGEAGYKKITQWTRYLTVAAGAPAVDRSGVPVPQRSARSGRSPGNGGRPHPELHARACRV